MYWGMNGWTSPFTGPDWKHSIQSLSSSLLTGSIRCLWPRPPSYTLFPLVPISLYSCFLLLSFLVFFCQLFLLYLIIRWWSPGLWLNAPFAFALLCLTLFRKTRSVPWRPSCYLHCRCSSHFQTNCYRHVHRIVSHHLHFGPGSLPDFHYHSEHTIYTCRPSQQDRHFRIVLDTASPHPPIPHTCTIYFITNSLPLYFLNISQTHPFPLISITIALV